MNLTVLSNLVVGQNHLGRAVFAARSFKKGDIIMQFNGQILHKNELPKRYKGEKDRYVQVGPFLFMGASNDIDDFFNHSCEPNAGLRFTENGVFLITIKTIRKGDEVAWDYSTTLFDSSWKMKCDCRTKNCRKIISDFILLDKKLQEKYKKLDVIPTYIKAYMESPDYMVYSKGVRSLEKRIPRKKKS